MKILVLNCGSSSLKYQLINMETDEAQGKKATIEKPAYDHKEAIEFTLAQLTNP